VAPTWRKPVRSQNRTLMALRSLATGAATWSSGAVQRPQNRKPSEFSLPQPWHTAMPGMGGGARDLSMLAPARPGRGELGTVPFAR
jgi:hypothetical protein